MARLSIIVQQLSSSAKGKELSLYRWLGRKPLTELITNYYRHDPDARRRPCGFVCTDTYNMLRVAAGEMEDYCRRVRGREKGYDKCRVSDYVGVLVATDSKDPVLYCCGGYAYDFTVPLRTKKGRVVGVFINGQLRPRIPIWGYVRSLCQRYELGSDLLEDYAKMPVLDVRRARTTADYLRTQMADMLEFYNRKSGSPDLDIDAFRGDVGILGGLLERAARDGLVKQSWRLLGKRSGLGEHFSAVPVLSVSNIPGDSLTDPYFEVAFRHPRNRELRASLSTDYSAEKGKDFTEISAELKSPKILSSKDPKDKAVRQLLKRFASKCYRAARQCPSGNGEERSGPAYWLAVGLTGGGQVGVLSLGAPSKQKLEQLGSRLCAVAKEVSSYLERYDLARKLTRAYGNSDGDAASGGYRKDLSRLAKNDLVRILNTPGRLEWKPLLENLRSGLYKIGDPDSLDEARRSSFDACVIQALGNPSYSPLEEVHASRWLREIKETAAEHLGGGAVWVKPKRTKHIMMELYEEQIRSIDDEVRWFETPEKQS